MCVLISTGRGVFIGIQGGVTNFVVADWPNHMASQPCGLASTNFLHGRGLPLLV
jgi:hypothetical protein